MCAIYCLLIVYSNRKVYGYIFLRELECDQGMVVKSEAGV